MKRIKGVHEDNALSMLDYVKKLSDKINEVIDYLNQESRPMYIPLDLKEIRNEITKNDIKLKLQGLEKENEFSYYLKNDLESEKIK